MIANFREGGFGGRDRGRGGFGGGRPRFGGGGRSFNGHRSSSPREMFDATCSKCGKACRVPFKPTGEKPVLCSDCFGGRESRSGGSQSAGDSKHLEQINAKLDKIIAILKELELDVDGVTDEPELEDSMDEEDEENTHEVVITPVDDTEEEF